MSFIRQLQRRNVLRAGAAYVVGSWVLTQVTSLGPQRFLPIRVEPAFDLLRDHPRYRAMEKALDAWNAEKQP